MSEAATVQIAQLDAMRAALKDACDLLEGWVLTKCPAKYRGEHMQHIQQLRSAGAGQYPAMPVGRHVIRFNGDGEFGQAVGWLYREGGEPCAISGKPVYVWRPLNDLMRTTGHAIHRTAAVAPALQALTADQLYKLAKAAGVLIVTQPEEDAAVEYGRAVERAVRGDAV